MRAALLAAFLAVLSACSLIDAASDGDSDCVDEECFGALEADPELAAPSVIAVGNLIGDGLPDVAVADRENGEVVVMENGGGGELFPIGSVEVAGPSWMAIADFHGDDGLEILCLSSGDTEIVMLGVDEDGPHEISRGAIDELPALVATGDFDGDDMEDFAVLFPGEEVGGLQIFRNNGGDGSFDGPNPSLSPGSGSGPLVAGDFDNDGLVDLLTSHDGMTKVFAGLGNRDFADYQVVGQVDDPILAAAAVDVSDDGLPDLILSTGGGAGQVLFVSNQSGDGLADGSIDDVVEQFDVVSDFLVGGDIDGDDLVDVIAFNADRQGDLPDAVTFQQFGDQSFDTNVWLFMDDPLSDAAAGDLDGDSDTDIAVAVPSQSVVRVYLSELE